jgi:hypothetical protein
MKLQLQYSLTVSLKILIKYILKLNKENKIN